MRSLELLLIGSLVDGASFRLVLVFGLVAGSLLSEDLVLEGVLLSGEVVSLEELALSTLKNFLCGTSVVFEADSLTGFVRVSPAVSVAVPVLSINLEFPLSVKPSACLSLVLTPFTAVPVLGSRSDVILLTVERCVVLTAPLLLGPYTLPPTPLSTT